MYAAMYANHSCDERYV